MTKYGQMLETYNKKETICKYAPLQVYLEPTNHCNLKCKNCANKDMTRPKGFMCLSTAYNSLYQIKTMGTKWVYLFQVGESTLHPEIANILQYANALGLCVRLHTNGIDLWSAIDEDLHTFRGPNDVRVSLNTITDLHISLNLTKFSVLEPVLESLINTGKSFTIDSIPGVSHPIPDKYKRYLFTKNKCYNWLGNVEGSPPTDAVCSLPYKMMSILWNGDVVPCCLDYNGAYIVGNINKNALKDIWNCDKMQAIRDPKFYKYTICRDCNASNIPEPEIPGYEDR